jgi:FdhD protein
MDGNASALTLPAARRTRRIAWRGVGQAAAGERTLPEEMPVSLVYQGTAHAVMLATPADLADFAVGFSLTEGLVTRPEDIESLAILPQPDGIVVRMHLACGSAELFWERRRALAGPSGCGLCGIESLAAALRPARCVESALTISCAAVSRAMAALSPLQLLNRETQAMHAAAFWRAADGIVALREDVGRHNALDKLAGALARARIDAADGAILLTSRVSIEMVQKAAAIGAPVVVAVSAPTARAVRIAAEAGITLAAIARRDGFEIFTHPVRLTP